VRRSEDKLANIGFDHFGSRIMFFSLVFIFVGTGHLLAFLPHPLEKFKDGGDFSSSKVHDLNMREGKR
jgi:hypothetical protein